MHHRTYRPCGELSQSVSVPLLKKNSEQFDHNGGLHE
jgi:hypothetical protein